MRRCIPFVSRPENCYVVDYFRLCDTVLSQFRRTRAEKEELMSRRLNLELELPDDIVAGLQDEDLTSKAKEAFDGVAARAQGFPRQSCGNSTFEPRRSLPFDDEVSNSSDRSH